MPERKRRVRTGCLTCRQRRVKCDEGKPTCQRCEFANVACAGYQAPRKIIMHKHPASASECSQAPAAPAPAARTSPPPPPPLLLTAPSPLSASTDRPDAAPNSPLVAYPANPADSQTPHRRAREVLAHQQYCSRTVTVLFRDDHLYFWRDRLLGAAWDTEYVYDAVVALGTMHRAVLLLAQPGDGWRGLDTKVAAFQAYGNTLKQMSQLYGDDASQRPEMLTAVLLLLAYFECFAGNPAGAFRHLRAATLQLSDPKSPGLPNYAPLAACANELTAVASIVLPMTFFPLIIPTDVPAINSGFTACAKPSQELQQLLSFISAHQHVNTAVWLPFSESDDLFDPKLIVSFQADLLRWKAASTHAFRDSDGAAGVGEAAGPLEWASLKSLAIPPQPRRFGSMESALAAAVFHCYMARTSWMISAANGEVERFQYAACSHAYETLRVVEGTWREDDERVLSARDYLPGNAVKIGLVPLLYLCSQFCYSKTWQQWITGKLFSIGQEGLYNGAAFASTLESLALFQSHVERLDPAPFRDMKLRRKSAFASTCSTVFPVMLPDTAGKIFVAYYVHVTGPKPAGGRTPLQIIGKATWTKQSDDASRNLAIEFFQPSHPINERRDDSCPYAYLASQEEIAREWIALFSSSVYSASTFLTNSFVSSWLCLAA